MTAARARVRRDALTSDRVAALGSCAVVSMVSVVALHASAAYMTGSDSRTDLAGARTGGSNSSSNSLGGLPVPPCPHSSRCRLCGGTRCSSASQGNARLCAGSATRIGLAPSGGDAGGPDSDSAHLDAGPLPRRPL